MTELAVDNVLAGLAGAAAAHIPPRPPPPRSIPSRMRVGVVDIGTNSTRLLIADVEDGAIAELDRRSEVTRLGQGVDTSGRLAEEAMERVFATLAAYRDALDAADVAGRRARRRAHERHARRRQRRRLHAPRARRLRARRAHDRRRGGGAADVPRRDPRPRPARRHAAARVRHRRRLDRADRRRRRRRRARLPRLAAGRRRAPDRAPPAPRPAAAARAAAARRRRARDDRGRRPARRSARARAPRSASPAPPRRSPRSTRSSTPTTRGASTATCSSCAEVELLLARLAQMPLAQRREVRGLHPDRAPTIVAGAAILLEVLRAFELDRAEVSEHDLLHGVALRTRAARADRAGASATAPHRTDSRRADLFARAP